MISKTATHFIDLLRKANQVNYCFRKMNLSQGGDPSTYIANTALLPSINLARLMQITAGVLQFFH